MKKRILSILTALALMLTLLPTAALAEGATSVNDLNKVDGVITLGTGGAYALSDNLDASIVVSGGVTATLDLGNYKLTNTGGQHTITVENGGQLTITGTGTVDNVSDDRAAVMNRAGGTVTIESGTFTRSAEASDNSWYVISNEGDMTIKGGTFKFSDSDVGTHSSLVHNGYYTAVEAENAYKANSKATMTITGGSFTGGLVTVKNSNGGELTVSGSPTFTQPTKGCYALLNWHKATINGGKFSGEIGTQKDNCRNSSANTSAGQLTINNATASNDKDGSNVVACANGELTITGGSFTNTGTNGYAVNAGITNNKCGDGETVTGTSTLTITGGEFVSKKSTGLYIKNGTASVKNATIKSETGYAVNVVGGTVDVTGATLTSDTGNAVCVAGGTATFTSSTIEGKANTAFYAYSGTTTISSGTITGAAGGIQVGYGTTTPSVTIQGGTITGKGEIGAVYVVSGSTTITGGTFSAPNYAAVFLSGGGTVAVSGGDFTSKYACIYNYSGPAANAVITGGTYSGPSIYSNATVPAGFTRNTTGTNTFSVTKNTGIVAYNGTSGYTSLTAAIEGATSGGTVTMLDNVSGEDVAVSKSITLDLNGHTLSGAVSGTGTLTLKNSGTTATATLTAGEENTALAKLIVDGIACTIRGGNYTALEVKNSGSLSITGGTFAVDPSSYVTASGYGVETTAVNSVNSYKVLPIQTAPTALSRSDRTTSSITLNTVAANTVSKTAAMYRLGTSGDWQTSPVFSNLSSGTTYTFYAYYPAVAGKYLASGTVSVTVSTLSVSSSGDSSSSSSSPSTSQTVTNTDGSTTTTTTDKSGNVTETTTSTTTATDGTKTESKTETKTATDGAVTETKTETKTATDGAKTETKVETQTTAAGVTTSTETVKETAANGSTGTTVTTKDETGATVTKAEATVSTTAVTEAKAAGEAVTLPVSVAATKSSSNTETAPTVAVSVPSDAGSVKVEIPVENVTAGTVAVLVHADGTEEIVKMSTVTEDGVALNVEGDVTVKIVDNSKDFNDISENHWAADNIAFVTSRELFQGTTTETFNATGSMTRQALMTVLSRLDGNSTTSVADGMAWAVEKGISDGSKANEPISRQQLAMMLYRYAGEPETDGSIDSFPDAGSVASYASAAMQWAVANGIIGGTTEGTLNPEGTATRAAVAAMVSRYVKAIG